MLSNIMLNIILVMFPILIYFVFSCYNISSNKSHTKILFTITLLTSLYLSLKYNNISDSNVLLFCNIPIIMAYIKKEKELGIILSVIMIIACYSLYHFSVLSIILSVIKYTLYLLAYILLNNKKYFKDTFITIIASIQGFFISFEYFFTYYNEFTKILKILLVVIIMYIITFISIYLLNLADKITTLYKDMQTYENQKQIKDSLFKLTHEIKNPIAVCKGYLDMLDLNNKEKIEKYIPIIKSEIDRSLNIMNDFMQYSKIKLELNNMDLTILLEDIYDSFKVLLKNKNIKLNYHNEYEEIYINGDYDRLKQVFINIIKNSMESIPKKGRININTYLEKNNIKIEITDNGIGMNKEKLDHIKEMFFTTKKNGTGLGVSLSNEIITLHKGKLEYNSKENEGTKCTITLPTIRSNYVR